MPAKRSGDCFKLPALLEVGTGTIGLLELAALLKVGTELDFGLNFRHCEKFVAEREILTQLPKQLQEIGLPLFLLYHSRHCGVDFV
jgi:hypothetical protein